MAINRSVSQQPVSVAEAQLARVAGEGCARHSHLNCFARSLRAAPARDLADAVHLLCSLHGRYPGLIEIALQRARRATPRLARSRHRGVRARAPLPGSSDVRSRPASEHAGRRRDGIEPPRGASRAGDTGEFRAQRLRTRRGNGTRRRLVADPSPARSRRGSRRARVPGAVIARRSSVIVVITAPPTPRPASGRWHSAANNCCSSTALCSICSKRAPQARGDY